MKSIVKKYFFAGLAFGLGLVTAGIIAVTVGETFDSGEVLTSTKLTALKNAVESIPDWVKNGNDAVYNAGNVGINTGGVTPPAATVEVNGNIISADPTAAEHVATKAYVDAQIPTMYIVTTRSADGGCNYPADFCPAGWTVETSWTFCITYGHNYVGHRQTLCKNTP